MSLNIKNEHTHAMVRELARVTGKSQTGAVEEAVERRLSELARTAGPSTAEPRDLVLDRLLRVLWDSGIDGLRDAERTLYDESGLPR